MKPLFKANPSDVILCPELDEKVTVEGWCHGYALRDELCPNSQNCEPYLSYVEKRLVRMQRKIRLTPELYAKLEQKAKAKGLTPEEFAEKVILKRVGGGEKP